MIEELLNKWVKTGHTWYSITFNHINTRTHKKVEKIEMRKKKKKKKNSKNRSIWIRGIKWHRDVFWIFFQHKTYGASSLFLRILIFVFFFLLFRRKQRIYKTDHGFFMSLCVYLYLETGLDLQTVFMHSSPKWLDDSIHQKSNGVAFYNS